MNVNSLPSAFGTGVNMPTVFGDWLKAERKKKHLTQDQLSEISDLTKAQISRLESGIQGTKRPTAVRLAEALGADPREALEALMADTPGLEPLPELDRIPEETLLEHIELYTGDNPVLLSAQAVQKALAAARAAGPVGGEDMPAVVRNGRGARKRIQDVDK